MEYKRFDNKIVARLDIGDDIVSKVMEITEKENIKLATVSAIGAINDLTIGIFKPSDKKYYENHFKDDFELLSLQGNISTMNNEPYVHLHITVGDEEGNAFGGHLNKAIISVTGELFIDIIDGEIDRTVDPKTTLNIFKF